MDVEGAVQLRDLPAYQRIYAWQHAESRLAVTQSQVFVLHEGRLYTLTVTALSESYDRYEPIFMRMLARWQPTGFVAPSPTAVDPATPLATPEALAPTATATPTLPTPTPIALTSVAVMVGA